MADGLNRVMLLGNLGADPELRFTQAGQAVLNMRLATTESYLDKDKVRRERTDWHSVVCWGRRGEALAKILAKGSSIFIEGSIRTSSYDDREGNKRYKTEIIAQNVILAGKRGGGGEGQAGEDESAGEQTGGSNGGGSRQGQAARGAPAGGGGGAPAPRPSEDPRVPFTPKKWQGPDFKGKNFSTCSLEFLRFFGEQMTWSADNPKDGNTQYVEGNRKNARLCLEWAAYLEGGGGKSNGSGGHGGGGGRPAPAPAPAAEPPAEDDYSGGYTGGGGGGGSYDDDIPFASSDWNHDPMVRLGH